MNHHPNNHVATATISTTPPQITNAQPVASSRRMSQRSVEIRAVHQPSDGKPLQRLHHKLHRTSRTYFGVRMISTPTNPDISATAACPAGALVSECSGDVGSFSGGGCDGEGTTAGSTLRASVVPLPLAVGAGASERKKFSATRSVEAPA